MAHGGKRVNAGRKNGSATKRKAAVKVQAVADGIEPAEVMQRAMEWHFKAKRYDQAAAVAKDLAPYRHPRLSAVQLMGEGGGPVRLVEELVIIHAAGNADAATASPPSAGGVPGQ